MRSEQHIPDATTGRYGSKIRPRIKENDMNQGWIVLMLVGAVLLGALLPLLHKDHPVLPRRDANDAQEAKKP